MRLRDSSDMLRLQSVGYMVSYIYIYIYILSLSVSVTSIWDYHVQSFGATFPLMIWRIQTGYKMLHHRTQAKLSISSSCLCCKHGCTDKNYCITFDIEDSSKRDDYEARSEVIRCVFFLGFLSGFMDVYPRWTWRY